MSEPSSTQAFDTECQAVLELAVELAYAAGKIQRERYETPLQIETKSASIDLVTEVDKACEALILQGLATHRPQDAILAEETGQHLGGDSDWRWVIDPLDGTTNFAHGFPCFTVSIGVEYQGLRTVGAIYHPLLDEMYTAIRGQGAKRNGKPISVSKENQLERSMLVTGFAYDVHTSVDDNMEHFRNFTKCVQATRRDGSAAWDLCAVACGRFDGFWEFKLNAWDVTAGFLIVEEAGGRCSDARGGPPSGASFVASNGQIHEAMLDVLNQDLLKK
ncbi:MAG: inositol monophosphatase [Deltaproteobacteria bacterium]|nr:inositol monophosphatase [Deltaproteobacteria bacterium]